MKIFFKFLAILLILYLSIGEVSPKQSGTSLQTDTLLNKDEAANVHPVWKRFATLYNEWVKPLTDTFLSRNLEHHFVYHEGFQKRGTNLHTKSKQDVTNKFGRKLLAALVTTEATATAKQNSKKGNIASDAEKASVAKHSTPVTVGSSDISGQKDYAKGPGATTSGPNKASVETPDKQVSNDKADSQNDNGTHMKSDATDHDAEVAAHANTLFRKVQMYRRFLSTHEYIVEWQAHNHIIPNDEAHLALDILMHIKAAVDEDVLTNIPHYLHNNEVQKYRLTFEKLDELDKKVNDVKDVLELLFNKRFIKSGHYFMDFPVSNEHVIVSARRLKAKIEKYRHYLTKIIDLYRNRPRYRKITKDKADTYEAKFRTLMDTLTEDTAVLLDTFEPMDQVKAEYTEKEVKELEFAGIHSELAFYQIRNLVTTMEKDAVGSHNEEHADYHPSDEGYPNYENVEPDINSAVRKSNLEVAEDLLKKKYDTSDFPAEEKPQQHMKLEGSNELVPELEHELKDFRDGKSEQEEIENSVQQNQENYIEKETVEENSRSHIEKTFQESSHIRRRALDSQDSRWDADQNDNDHKSVDLSGIKEDSQMDDEINLTETQDNIAHDNGVNPSENKKMDFNKQSVSSDGGTKIYLRKSAYGVPQAQAQSELNNPSDGIGTYGKSTDDNRSIRSFITATIAEHQVLVLGVTGGVLALVLMALTVYAVVVAYRIKENKMELPLHHPKRRRNKKSKKKRYGQEAEKIRNKYAALLLASKSTSYTSSLMKYDSETEDEMRDELYELAQINPHPGIIPRDEECGYGYQPRNTDSTDDVSSDADSYCEMISETEISSAEESCQE